MKVLIIEDEKQAARLLASIISEVKPGATILGVTDSVESSLSWLQSNPSPDLIFMDIQLGDGLSFEIFEKTLIQCPVIFTTAYDEYALRAFKVNSVDYILKPVDPADIRSAILKYENLFSTSSSKDMLENIGLVMQALSKKYKERFVIKVGERLKTVEVKDIHYFYSQDKATFCQTRDGRSHILDFTLEQLEGMVDPGQFFRVNRKFLVGADAIADMINYTNSRLKLRLKGNSDEVIVARERVLQFKDWLDR